MLAPRGPYVIVDVPDPHGIEPARVAAAVARGGAGFVQLRAKAADTAARVSLLRAMLDGLEGRAALVVNDDLEAALRVDGVWGLHLGIEDLVAASSFDRDADVELDPRTLVATRTGGPRGPGLRAQLRAAGLGLGLSTHRAEHLALARALAPAYLAFGPVYPTTSKSDTWPVVGLDALREVATIADRPVVAIGGIGVERVAEVRRAGAAAFAVIAAARGSTEAEIEGKVRNLVMAFESAG